MITLGINAAFHDSSAALVADGQVIAAAEEERFTRIKHAKRALPFSAWELPWHAMQYCLQHQGIGLAEVDHVAYSFDPRRFLQQRAPALLQREAFELPLAPSAADRSALRPFDSPWDPLFAAHVLNAPRQLAGGAPHHLRQSFRGVRHDGPYRFHFLGHHLCHQASAFLAAPFERCAVLTLDGRGEDATTSYGRWHGDRYEALGEVTMPHSLGLLYEDVTAHLGFLRSSDEYKVMALAALGHPRFRDAMLSHVSLPGDGQYRIAPLDLAAWSGPPRERGATSTCQRHRRAAPHGGPESAPDRRGSSSPTRWRRWRRTRAAAHRSPPRCRRCGAPGARAAPDHPAAPRPSPRYELLHLGGARRGNCRGAPRPSLRRRACPSCPRCLRCRAKRAR